MPDGDRLTARTWLPRNNGGPYPAILEIIPYRRRDLVRARDERNHPFLASHGFACLRVDMRGSGDSDGIMEDMYSDLELDDTRRVIDWIAAQPWCSGRVGMFGTSWGGTASLQAAVDAPPPLKAVLANCATWDRFEDDIHWMGGCLLTDSFEWGATLPAILAAPPDSATVGEEWKEIWKKRLNALSFPLEHWMTNRVRGKYWRHGSVRFAAERLSCPILAVGGWSDRYSNSVLNLVRARPDICRGIVGPWGHHYPDQGEPGPPIGFQKLMLEWWDHWLRQNEPGDIAWPSVRLWRRSFDPPQDRLETRSGDWIEIEELGKGRALNLVLENGTLLGGTAAVTGTNSVPYDIRHGECAGDTGYFGRVGGLPLEQSPDDRRSVCFETPPLEEEIDLIGSAVLVAKIFRREQQAQLVCRLCDIDPGGRSNLVARGIINLELDETLDSVASFTAGEERAYRLELPATAYRFARGHRVRLALAASYWPLVWPTAEDPEILIANGSMLELPAATALGRLSREFEVARDHPKRKSWRSLPGRGLQRTPQHIRDGRILSSWRQPEATTVFDSTGTSMTVATDAQYGVGTNGKSLAECQISYRLVLVRPDGKATITSRLETSGTGESIAARQTLKVTWGGYVLLRTVRTFEVAGQSDPSPPTPSD